MTEATVGKLKETTSGEMSEGVRFALEFRKAAQRLMSQRGQYGGALPCAMAWLLQFAHEDFHALASGGISDRWQEVRRFSFDAGLAEAVLQGDSHAKLLTQVASVELEARSSESQLIYLLEVQREVRSRIEAYVAGHEVLFEGQRVKYEVSRNIHDPASGRVRLHVGNAIDGVLLHLLYLLAELGPRVKPCIRCNKLFLAGRTDKTFCSGLCQAKKYKQDHPKEKKPIRRQKKGGKHAKKR